MIKRIFKGVIRRDLSNRFKKKTVEMIKKLKTRNLSDYDFECIVIDGERYAKKGLLIAFRSNHIWQGDYILDVEQSFKE